RFPALHDDRRVEIMDSQPPSQPLPSATLPLLDQVRQILQEKQWRDTHAAKRAERVCGCPQCRRSYRQTLRFYARLSTVKPERESLRRRSAVLHLDHPWYHTPYGHPGSLRGED